MQIGRKIRTMAGALPYDERLTCLTFDQHHHFNTDIILKNDYTVTCAFSVPAAVAGMRVWSNEGGNPFADNYFTPAPTLLVRNRGVQSPCTVIPNKRHETKIVSDYANNFSRSYFDGVLISNVAFQNPFVSGQQVILGNRKYLSTAEGLVGSVYVFSILRNNARSIDWIPVLKDAVPCFYDTISGTFHYNNGSGIPGYTRENGTIVPPA